jgi:hypothetical protein
MKLAAIALGSVSCSAKLTRQEGNEVAAQMLRQMSSTLETGSMAASGCSPL